MNMHNCWPIFTNCALFKKQRNNVLWGDHTLCLSASDLLSPTKPCATFSWNLLQEFFTKIIE
jgi:hypothetical protein